MNAISHLNLTGTLTKRYTSASYRSLDITMVLLCLTRSKVLVYAESDETLEYARKQITILMGRAVSGSVSLPVYMYIVSNVFTCAVVHQSLSYFLLRPPRRSGRTKPHHEVSETS